MHETFIPAEYHIVRSRIGNSLSSGHTQRKAGNIFFKWIDPSLVPQHSVKTCNAACCTSPCTGDFLAVKTQVIIGTV